MAAKRDSQGRFVKGSGSTPAAGKSGATFKVMGIKELDKALKGLEPKIARKVLRQAMRGAMKQMKAEAQSNAPEGETAALEASIKVRAGKRKRGSMSILVGLTDITFKGRRWYATFAEWGSSVMEGRAYMRRAYDSKKEAVRADAIRRIQIGVEREVAAARKS